MEKENKFLKMSNEDYDKYMCKEFPELFQDRNKPMSETCMCWGFNIGEGWYKIIYDLCEKLDFIRKQTGIVTVFDQIKEKFGTGRFYYHCDTSNCYLDQKAIDVWHSFIENAVSKAEDETCHTCASCGEYHWSDKISLNGWVQDSCVECLVKEKDCKKAIDKIIKRLSITDEITDKIYRMTDIQLDTMQLITNYITEEKQKSRE